MRILFAFVLFLAAVCSLSAQSFDHAKRLSKSSEVKDRLAAIAEFRKMPTPPSFSELAELYRDPDSRVRAAAVEAFEHVISAYDDPICAQIRATKDEKKQQELETLRGPVWKFAYLLQMGDYLKEALDALANPEPGPTRALILKMASLIYVKDSTFEDDEEEFGFRCGTGYNFTADTAFYYAIARRPEVAIGMLNGPDITIKEGLILGLGRAATPKALPNLLAFARSRNNGLRRAAAGALGYYSASEAYDALTAMADDRATMIRSTVAASLGQIDAKRATPILLRMMSDPKDSVCESVCRALKDVQDDRIAPVVIDVFSKAKNERRGMLCVFMKSHPSILYKPLLLGYLNEARDFEAKLAVDALADTPGPDVKELMLKLAHDKRGDVRSSAAMGLRRWNDPDVWSTLEDLLKDPEYSVFSSACYSLGELRVTSALGALRSIKSDDHYVNEAVQQAINKITGTTDPP